VALAVLGGGCAPRFRPAAPGVAERARQTRSYSARVRVSLVGDELRGRSWTLVAFRRPDALRIEVPGPAGARVIAVASDSRLTAVFPEDRAVFSGSATREALQSLLGVGLLPEEVIDLLVGLAPADVTGYRVGWGPRVPERVRARLPDGARLDLQIESPRLEPELPGAAFDAPPHPGYRVVGAAEARSLWSR
jgi:hypothetical protein